jgi:hypothetical protein
VNDTAIPAPTDDAEEFRFDESLHSGCPEGFTASYTDCTGENPPWKSTEFKPIMPWIHMTGLTGRIDEVYLNTYYQKQPRGWLGRRKKPLVIERQDTPVITLHFDTTGPCADAPAPEDSGSISLTPPQHQAKQRRAQKIYETMARNFGEMGYKDCDISDEGLDIYLTRKDKPLFEQMEEIYSTVQKLVTERDKKWHARNNELPPRKNKDDPYSAVAEISRHVEKTRKKKSEEETDSIMALVKEHMNGALDADAENKLREALLRQRLQRDQRQR